MDHAAIDATCRSTPNGDVVIPCWQVDAFTNRPFGGNPAAVCWLDAPRDPRWMQNVAAEMNLSETAFVRPVVDGLELRWFTPTVEVDLCGHATLATAHALWNSSLVTPQEPLRFHTKSGVLTCTRDGDFIELDFPSMPAVAAEPIPLLTEALGREPAYLGRSRFDLLAAFESESVIRSIQSDFRKLKQIPVRGVIVTALSDDPSYDFVDRFFAPAVGVDEDPVCGSAHCCLTPYWAEQLGKTELMAHQVSTRGGVLRLKLRGDRVILGGQAVTVWRGELLRRSQTSGSDAVSDLREDIADSVQMRTLNFEFAVFECAAGSAIRFQLRQ